MFVLSRGNVVHVLLIEDDLKVVRMLTLALNEEGFTVEVAGRGDAGLRRLLDGAFDLCILDLQLPDMSGFQVLQHARGAGSLTPILVLTARDSVPDRVHGLNLGADDYLVKPFAFAELIARMRALLRRGASPRAKLRAGGLELDPAARRVVRDGHEIDLSPKQFTLLEFLLRHKNQVVTRSMVLKQVWGYEFEPGTNVVDVQIAHLRQKIDTPGAPSLIQTIRGVGYRIDGDDDA